MFDGLHLDGHRTYRVRRWPDLDDILSDAYRDDMRFTVGVLRSGCAGLYYGLGDLPPVSEQANI